MPYLIALAVLLACIITVLLIGLHVVKKYPDTLDHRRNLKRYTYPAAWATLIAVLIFIGLIGFGLAALIGNLTA